MVVAKGPKQVPGRLQCYSSIKLFLITLDFTVKYSAICSTVGFVCFWRDSPPVDHGLLVHEVSRSHTRTHHSREDSSGRVTSSSQRPLPYNTQHSQHKNFHDPGGFRNHNLSRRAAADLRLRSRGHSNCGVEKLINNFIKYQKLLASRITAFLSATVYLPLFAVQLQGCVLAVPAVSLI